MASRKWGNIYFLKCFMAVRPFLTRIFFQELFGLEGSKHFHEKIRQVHNLKISDRLLGHLLWASYLDPEYYWIWCFSRIV